MEKIKNYKNYLVACIQEWFEVNGPDCKACVAVSGGKDSSVVAALCVEALGKERVFGVLMPNGAQKDIEDSYALCRHLGIDYVEVNISGAYDSIIAGMRDNGIEISEQTKVNLPARLRMSTLYAVAQSKNGRVIGTSNFDEYMLGFFTRWGDGVSDYEPIIKMHVSEVVELGLELGLPEYLVKKTPSDGLGETIKSDEEKLGFGYGDFEKYWGYWGNPNPEMDPALKDKISSTVSKSAFKRFPIPEPFFRPDLLPDEWAEVNVTLNEHMPMVLKTKA